MSVVVASAAAESGGEPDYQSIVSRRFPHLQQFVGEQLIRMKLASQETEAMLTFQILEHAGRKVEGNDFGFDMCTNQAKHLRKLNQMINDGQGTSAGSTFAAIFGALGGANQQQNHPNGRVNFFDLDEGEELRAFLRARLGNRTNNADVDRANYDAFMRRHLHLDEGVNSNMWVGPERTAYRVRFGIWCFMMCVFFACTALLYFKGVQHFIFASWAVHRSVVDLAVILMLPATSSIIVGVGLANNVVLIARKKVSVLPPFERYKLLRFLINLAVLVTFVTIALKFRSMADEDNVAAIIGAIARRDNSTMCYYQLLHNCSGGIDPCDRNSFFFGNNSVFCPRDCGYENTAFKEFNGNVSLWWSPTKGCADPVQREVILELVFSAVVSGVLILFNLAWGCVENTCFERFNRN